LDVLQLNKATHPTLDCFVTGELVMSTHNQSRRVILRGLLASGCALYLPRLSMAQAGKLNKEQAQYQNQPKGDQKCGNCMHFIPPDSCMVVEGNISSDAWCKLWVKKPVEDPVGKM
jgi:hypothetical protein